MENALKGMQSSGSSIYDDKASRMPYKPPPALEPGKGKRVEDLGSGFAARPGASAPSRTTAEPAGAKGRAKRTVFSDDSDSADELNLRPSRPTSRLPSPSTYDWTQDVPSLKPRLEFYVDEKGKSHSQHPDFPLSNKDKLKRLGKIKKNKPADPPQEDAQAEGAWRIATGSTPEPELPSTRTSSARARSPVRSVPGSSGARAAQNGSHPSATSSSGWQTATGDTPERELSSTRRPSRERPPSRSAPGPSEVRAAQFYQNAARAPSGSTSRASTQGSQTTTRSLPPQLGMGRAHRPYMAPSKRTDAPTTRSPVPASTARSQHQPGAAAPKASVPAPFPLAERPLPSLKGKEKSSVFPDLPPLDSSLDDTPRPTKERSTGSKASKLGSFPMLSPLRSPRASSTSPPPVPPSSSSDQSMLDKRSQPKPAPFPLADPPGGKSPPREKKKKAKDLPRPQAKKAKGKALEAFPMSTQVLKGIGSVQRLEDGFDTSDNDDGSDAERSRLDVGNLFIDSAVDPKSLCPYCDEPLPPRPTAHLSSLLAGMRKKSKPEPRPSNPLGRRAPVSLYVTVCQRHQFEAVWLPRAAAEGWPTEIDFAAVRRRVEARATPLRALVNDVAAVVARNASVFWTEALKEVRALGRKAAGGVGGQFHTFERAQPGYYGEVGALVIYQTLHNMFPPERLDADTVAPLTPDDFVRRVLVPEVAVALIEEDLGVSRTAAIRTLRDSAQYGVAIFPDDANAGARGAQAAAAGASEADRMMHERATARRRELEAEEAAERAGIAATESDADDDGEVDLSFVAPRARPIAPRARKREALELSGASAGEASPPRPKRRKTPTPAASEKEAPAGDVMDIDTDSDAGARRTTARSRFRKPLSQSTAENSPVRPQGRAAKPGKVKERSRGASEDEERNLMPSRLKRRVEDSDSDLEIVPSIVKRDKGKARSQDVLDIESTPQPEKKEKTRAVDRAIFGTAPDDKPLLAARRKKREPQGDGWSHTMLDDELAYSDSTGASLSDADRRARAPKNSRTNHAWLLADEDSELSEET